jgi:FkbM family methyltransferase
MIGAMSDLGLGSLAKGVRRAAFSARMRYKAAFDEAELRLVPRLCPRDRAFLDVGANHGIYSWAASRVTSRVIAVEPNPTVAAALARAFDGRVEVIAAALSDRSGTVTLQVPLHGGKPLTTRGTLDASGHGAAECQSIDVPCHRLDELSLPPLGMIKIDVEGHERAVLDGARATIERDRPVLLVELEERHAPGATRAVPAMLADLGYDGWFLLGGELQPLARFAADVHQRPENAKPPDGPRRGVYINNFVFTPRAAATARGSRPGTSAPPRARDR